MGGVREPREHQCRSAGRTCASCRACDVTRRRMKVQPAGQLPYGVQVCSHCDGDRMPRFYPQIINDPETS